MAVAWFNFLVGSFHGVASHRENPIDVRVQAAYFSIVTPITMFTLYKALMTDAATRVYLVHSSRMSTNAALFAGLFVGSCIANGIPFGMGHVLGRTASTAFGDERPKAP